MHVQRKFIFLFQDGEALRVRLHHAVFDSVVHHLDKVPGAGRPDMPPSLIPGRSKRFKHGTQTVYRGFVAADHHRVAFLQAPDSAAGAHVRKRESLRFQSRRAALRVLIIAVSASIRISSWDRCGRSAAIVSSTGAPDGTIIHIARGGANLPARLPSESAPSAPAATTRATAAESRS